MPALCPAHLPAGPRQAQPLRALQAARPGLPSRRPAGRPGCPRRRPPFSAARASRLLSVPVGWRGQLCRATPRHPQGGLPGGRRGASLPARLRGSLAHSVSSLLARGALGALGPGGVGEGLQACFSNTARAHRQLPAAPPFLPPLFRAGTATEGQPGASRMEEPGWGGHRGPWEAGGERLPRAPLLRPGTASGPQQAWGRPGRKRARR